MLYFRPRGLLNLELQDQLESAAPIMAAKVRRVKVHHYLPPSTCRCFPPHLSLELCPFLLPFNQLQAIDSGQEGTAQFVALCGRGPRSTFRTLRHGLEVSQIALSELPGNPNAVWSIKRHADGE